MTSIAELGIKINSQGVDEASQKLDNLAKSGEKAESSLAGIKEPVKDLKKELSSLSSQSGNILDDRSIKAFDKTISSVRSSTQDAVSGIKELTQASTILGETEEQAALRTRNMVAAALERKQASLEAAEAMRLTVRASNEEGQAWQDTVKAQNQAMKSNKDLLHTTKDLGVNQKELARETAKSEKEFTKLLKVIDPTQAAINKLDTQVEELGKQFDAGKISQDQYVQGLKKFDAEYAKLESTTSRFSNTTKTTRRNVLQLLNALRSGNIGVATNNIAELGVSSNVSAVSMLRLAAPIGLVATAIGTLGYAYVRAYRENQEFNKAIYLTGNYAGTSLSNLNKMAKSIRGVGGNQKSVVTALAEVTKTGKFTESQLKEVATAALKMQAAFDIPISQTISKFEELGDSPSQSILKLNEQYNFLTTAVYDQIRALELQGDKTGATNLAIQTFSKAQQEAAQKAVSNTGYLERSWKGVTGAINDAVAALVNFGKTNNNTIEERRKATNRELNDLLVLRRSTVGRKDQRYGDTEYQASINKELARIDSEIERVKGFRDSLAKVSSSDTSATPDDKAKLEKEKLQFAKYYDELFDSAKTNAEKFAEKKRELDQKIIYNLKNNSNDPRLQGITYNNGVLGGKNYERLVAALQKQYKDPSTNTSGRGNASSDSMLSNLRQQEAVLREQLNTTEKLTSAQSQLVKFEQQIADLKEKKSLTAAQKVLLANEGQIKAQLSLNAAIENEIRLRKETQAQKQWMEALNDKLSAKQGEVDLQSATVWMGTRQAEEYKELINIQKDYARQKLALARNQDTENRLTTDTYEKRIQELDAAMAKEVEIVKRGQAQKREAEENWLHGANASYQNYLEEARNVSKQTESLFTNAFSGMEDALVSFVRTGTLSFSDFANAVLDDLARIGVRMATSSALQAVFGSALGGLFGNYSGASSQLDGLMSSPNGLFAKGGAFSSGAQAFAKGDTFTNSIVSSATPFQFAKGGIPSLGVMGEAGDEAIMPLTRTSNGDLGVRAIIDRMGEISTTGSSGNNIQVYVTVDSNGNTDTTTSTANQSGQDLATLIDSALQQWVTKQKRQGGLLNPNNRRNQ